MENLNDKTAAEAVAANSLQAQGTTPDANTLVGADGNPTEVQIEQWKAKYGKVKYFEVDGLKVYFKQPDRVLVKAANSALAKTRDVDAYQETILKNTQLNFQSETAADVELYFALANKVDEIITSKVASLGN